MKSDMSPSTTQPLTLPPAGRKHLELQLRAHSLPSLGFSGRVVMSIKVEAGGMVRGPSLWTCPTQRRAVAWRGPNSAL